jgi:hypothetical protein
MTVRIAGPFWSRALPLLGAAAVTMPNKRIYVLEQYADDSRLIYHETVHIKQMERDGVARFCVQYLWWLVRYGYWRNPYEIEAFHRDGRNMLLNREGPSDGR